MIDKYIIKFCIFLDNSTAWIDRFIYKFFGILDKMAAGIDRIFGPRCKCKKKKK